MAIRAICSPSCASVIGEFWATCRSMVAWLAVAASLPAKDVAAAEKFAGTVTTTEYSPVRRPSRAVSWLASVQVMFLSLSSTIAAANWRPIGTYCPCTVTGSSRFTMAAETVSLDGRFTRPISTVKASSGTSASAATENQLNVRPVVADSGLMRCSPQGWPGRRSRRQVRRTAVVRAWWRTAAARRIVRCACA